jgi:hypothetical protein
MVWRYSRSRMLIVGASKRATSNSFGHVKACAVPTKAGSATERQRMGTAFQFCR